MLHLNHCDAKKCTKKGKCFSRKSAFTVYPKEGTL
ncbi:MAG: hypothetical protein J5846_03685 [Desulfovibrio sp.]|nr:hypothetical protein [Desulfovibrio sp.]